MSLITSQNAAQAIVKLVAAEALEALVGNLRMGALVNRNYEPTLAQAGDTVNVAIPPVMAANNIAESGSVQTQNPSLGNAQIVLNSHIESTFQIPDATKVLVVPDLVKTYMQPAIIAIAEKIETDILSTYPLFTYNSTLGGNSAMTEAVLDSAETTLFNVKVPEGAPRFAVVSSTAFSALRQISRFTEFQTIGFAAGGPGATSPMVSGNLPGSGPYGANGQLKNLLLFRSQYVPAVSSVYQNLVFSPDALGLVIRRLPQPLPGTGAIAEYAEMGNFGLRVVMSYAPNTLAQQFTVDCLYGVGALRQQFAVIAESN